MCIKIVITDDHPMVISGIAAMLQDAARIGISGVYQNGSALLEGLALQQPDVLLLDMRLPDIMGPELVKKIWLLYPQQKIIIVTNEDNPYLAKEMLKLGCKGYLLKSASRDVIMDAIEKVYAGSVYIDAPIQQLIIDSAVHGVSTTKIHLTPREEEILNLLCEGLSSHDIADKLFLSHRTIDAHRHSLNQKFNVKNTTALVKKAMQAGWIQ